MKTFTEEEIEKLVECCYLSKKGTIPKMFYSEVSKFCGEMINKNEALYTIYSQVGRDMAISEVNPMYKPKTIEEANQEAKELLNEVTS